MGPLAILCPGKAREEGKIKPTATDTLHTQIYCVALNIKRHYTRLRSKGPMIHDFVRS